MDKGQLIFEYNLMIIDRSIAKSAEKIAPGKHTIVVNTTLKAAKPGSPADWSGPDHVVESTNDGL